MQITRQRVRPEEHIETAEQCPVCKGTGKVVPTILFADELEQKVFYILKDLNKNRLTLMVHPYLAAYLTKGFPSIRTRWFMKYYKYVRIESVQSYALTEYRFLDEKLEEIIV